MSDINSFARQLEELLGLSRTFADRAATDLMEQLDVSASIEAAANDVRESNLRVLTKLLQLFDPSDLPRPASGRASEIADGIARQLKWPARN